MKLSVFIKKHPNEIKEVLELKENQDICTLEEYVMKFNLPSNAGVSVRLKKSLVDLGLVSQEMFPSSK